MNELSPKGSDASAQQRYHDDRFDALAEPDRVRIVIEDLTGSATHEGWIGLDQMGHFGTHGCELVTDQIVARHDKLSVLVELGSGYGGALRDVLHRLSQRGVDVDIGIGTDVVTRHCTSARRIGADSGLPAVFVAGDAALMPLTGSTADAVFAAGSMPHFTQSGAVLAEAWRILRPGGTLVMTEEVSLLRDHRLPSASFVAEHPHSVFSFSTVDERTRQLHEAGFDPVSFTDLTDWALALVDARLRAVRLLRGTAERVYGEKQLAAIEQTLVVTLDAYRDGTLRPGSFASVRRGSGVKDRS